MSNPFDWRNQASQISVADLQTAHKNSYQSIRAINRKRQAGVEPSIPYSPNSRCDDPKLFAVKMPDMPLYKRPKKPKN